METLCAVALVLMLGIVIVGLAYRGSENDKRRIHDFLVQKGATQIQVARAWLDGDRDTATYTVEFLDAQGQRRQTRCKIRIGLLDGTGDIYWKDPV